MSREKATQDEHAPEAGQDDEPQVEKATFKHFIRIFRDFARGQGDVSSFQAQINSSVLNFVYLLVARFIVGYFGSLAICVAAARTTNALRKDFLSSLLRQEIAHFDRSGSSVASQVTTNGARINAGIAEKLYNLVNGISLFLSSFVVALAVQPVLAIIIMSIVPGMLITVGASIFAMIPIEARVSSIYAHAGTIAQDALGSIKTIFALGSESKILRWYEAKLQHAHEEGRKKSFILGPLFSSQYFFTLSGTALGFWQGFRMYLSGQIDVGKVLTVILSVTLGASSLTTLMGSIENVSMAASAACELFAKIDRPSLLDPLSRQGKRPNICTGSIELRDVSFAYPSRPSVLVLNRLNLSIPAGKTTALVGPSGCGKSTIVGLLERWYEPASGQVLLDGQEISGFNTKWLRNRIRLIQQEPTLFSGSVYDNVANGLTEEQIVLPAEMRMKLVENACKAADAHDFVSRLPQGYRKELGERGGMLSGGQLQRISIARSIVSGPKILLCDESTSALDPRAEKAVQDSLESVSKDKTTLIIAHKLATVKAADNIAVMKDGKVVEQGTHEDLIQQDSLYAAMVRAQDLGEQSRLQDTPFALDARSNKAPEGDPTALDLQRTQTKEEYSRLPGDHAAYVSQGTLNYSLIRCIWIMLKENKTLYNWYLLISVAYIMVGGTYPAQAVLFSRMINVFTLQGDDARSQADFYALMFFVLAIANLLGYFCIGISVNTIGQELTHRYRHEMLERLLGFDLDFFDCPEDSSGALTACLSSVPAAVQELMSTNLGLLLTVLVNMVSTSVLGIAYGWKLGLVMVFAGLSVIVGSGFIRIRLDQKLEARTEAQFSKSASLAAEAVGSIRTVSLLTMEDSVLREYGRTLDGIVSEVIRSLLTKYWVTTLIPYTFSQSAEFLVLALGFWYGSRLIADGEYDIEQFFTIFIAIVFGGQAAAQLFTYTTSITRATGNANYILWLRTIKSNIREDDQNRDKGPPEDDISIQGKEVDFYYKQRPEARILKRISIDVKTGCHAAFVGPSGCGKSTILSLVERLYDPTSGSMLMNGKVITQYSPKKYRETMSIVEQNPPLYLGSVRENIAIGLDYEPSDDDIREACEQANAQDFIASLPDGLNTQCGSRGLQFSGGQRQRIAVARALIRKPRLLLLDEATSALDTRSERVVQDALNKASSTRTTISVAHRLSTIRHADVIFVVEDGRIAETGTHDELLRLRGRYHAMCLAQSLDQAP